MVESNSTLFRERAIKQYMQGQQKDTLLRLIAVPVYIVLWLLLVGLQVAMVILVVVLSGLLGGW